MKKLFFILLTVVIAQVSIAGKNIKIIVPEKKESILRFANELVGNRKSEIIDISELKKLDSDDLYICLGDKACKGTIESKTSAEIIGVYVSKKLSIKNVPNFISVSRDIEIENQLALINSITNKAKINVLVIDGVNSTYTVNKHGKNYKKLRSNKNEKFSVFIKKKLKFVKPDFLILEQQSNLTNYQISIILMMAYELKIPVIGFSINVVENGAGATASVYIDQSLIVDLTHNIIEAILGKNDKVEKQGEVKVIFNQKLLRKYGLNYYPGDTLRNAKFR